MTDMTDMFEKFNEMVDLAGLKTDIEKAASSNGEFEEVPVGDYEVKVVKLELGATGEKAKNPGMPMAKVWFEVLAGEYKGQKIFMNQMLTSGFGIFKMNELMSRLDESIPVVFENFTQYADLMEQIFNSIDGVGEYQLHYDKNNKGYNVFEIIKRFK